MSHSQFIENVSKIYFVDTNGSVPKPLRNLVFTTSRNLSQLYRFLYFIKRTIEHYNLCSCFTTGLKRDWIVRGRVLTKAITKHPTCKIELTIQTPGTHKLAMAIERYYSLHTLSYNQTYIISICWGNVVNSKNKNTEGLLVECFLFVNESLGTLIELLWVNSIGVRTTFISIKRLEFFSEKLDGYNYIMINVAFNNRFIEYSNYQ